MFEFKKMYLVSSKYRLTSRETLREILTKTDMLLAVAPKRVSKPPVARQVRVSASSNKIRSR